MNTSCIVPTGAAATRYGERPAYSEGLYEIGPNVYAWMVPNGSWGESNTGLVVGEDTALLIDTLWDVPKTETMLDAMQSVLDGVPLETVVNTHADGDHFWGNQLLADADSITSEGALEEMRHHRPGAMLAFERLGRVLANMPFGKLRAAGRYFQAMCAPYDFASVTHTPAKRSFSDALDLDIGGRLVRLIEVGPAHTQGDLIVHVPDAGIVFAADVLFVGVTPVMWAGPLANWLDALDLILSLDADVIIPGHGPVTDKSGVRLVRAYWKFVSTAVRERFEAGAPASEAAYDIVTSAVFGEQPFASWDSPERIMTNVHMLYREFAGKTAPMGLAKKIRLMARQAALADALPGASPAVMHRL
jgi:cyclase